MYTIEQIKSQFFHDVTEEEINRYANHVRDSITQEDVTDLIAEIGENLEKHAAADPKEAEALKSYTPLDRITFYIREAFVAGAVYSMDMLSKVNEISIDALENFTVEAQSA